jgi:acetylglutamate/LysW-gamma-L-alpha-aminoadipate kinase
VIPDLIVVKCGGTAQVSPTAVCAAVAEIARAGQPVLLVHGGSAAMMKLAGRLGVSLSQLNAPDGTVTRRTDAATMEVLTLALAGQAKPELVLELARCGVSAVGLTGLDAGILAARRKKTLRNVIDGRTLLVRDDHSGLLSKVRTGLLRMLIEAGCVPVLSPPALAEDGSAVNVNADRVAAAVAAALGAQRLVLLTAAPGVLSDPTVPDSLQARYRLDGRLDPAVRGGMKIKLVAAAEALRGGVPEVLIADGRALEPVRSALAGRGGTRVLAEVAAAAP